MTAMDAYTVALLAHILVVVYLLGADLGRLYLARLGAARDTAGQARLAAARGAVWLGLITDAALVLVLPVGVSLGASVGVFRVVSPGWVTATWLVCAAWLALSVAATVAAGRPGGGRRLALADSFFRLVMGAGQVYDGVNALLGTSVSVEAHWLGIKLVLFGLLILLSIPARRSVFAIRASLAQLDAVPGDYAADARLAAACGRLPAPVIAGWLVILAAAWLGVAKPG
jgi:hypothetical protein